MDKTVFAAYFAFVAASAFAGEFHVRHECDGMTVSLADASVYKEGVAPSGAGDVICIKDAWPYTSVSVADAASMELLAKIDSLQLGYGCRLELRCDVDFTLPIPVSGDGTLVKGGSGVLQQSSKTGISSGSSIAYKDYFVNLDVQSGVLRMPMFDVSGIHYHYAVNVAEGATLVTASNAATQVYSLSGFGTITNEQSGVGADGKAAYAQLNITKTGPDTGFDGVIAGPIMIRPASGFLTLRNPANTFTGGVQLNQYVKYAPVGGVLQVAKFANAGEPSSLGAGESTVISTSTGGGLVRYIGDEGSSTDRGIALSNAPLVLDGGHHGGVSFYGTFASYGSTKTLSELQLAGSNAVPCDIYGELRSYEVDGIYRPFYIWKHGTGTWRIFDRIKSGKVSKVGDQNAPRGVIEVGEGTLEFDSLCDAGSYCALGFAMDLYRRGTGEPTQNDKVDYAWLLGGTDGNGNATEGRMLYTGEASVQCTNRLTALSSSGAFGTSQARVRLFGVRPEGEGAKTLALEAPAGITNDLYDIYGTAESPIGIVKRGPGSWRIGGNVSLGGGIDVKEGELVVENRPKDSAYTWFRLTIKQTAATCPRYKDFTRPDGVVTNFNSADKYVMLAELALFDEDGRRINIGITPAAEPLSVFCGQSQIGVCNPNPVTYYHDADTYCLFDNVKPTPTLGKYSGGMRFYTERQINIDDSSTWVPIVFRLTNGTSRAVSCDFVYPCTLNNATTSAGRCPTAMKLEASNDGVNWENVWEDDSIEIPAGKENDYRWISDGEGWSAGYSRLRKAPEKSFGFSRAGQMRSTAVLADVPVLSVASGAVLRIEGDDSVPAPRISKIAVDASAGIGKVFGAAFSEYGSVEIANVPENLPVSFSLAQGDASGLENLKNWDVSFADGASGRITAAISPDGSSLTISKRGLTVVVR